MKKFLQGVALFLVPVLLVVGLFGTALWRSGEWRTEEDAAAQLAQGKPVFFGLAYRDNTRYYKHLATQLLAPELLVLGTSRSMQFRGEFFTTDSFYNAGGGASYINEFEFFLRQLPADQLPRTLILVMDQYFFNEGWVGTSSMPTSFDYSHYDFAWQAALGEVMQGWARGKFSLWQVLGTPAYTYGMSAAGRGRGFYPDGSYSYGYLMDHPEEGTDVAFHDSLDRIARGVDRFEYGDALYQPSLEVVQSLLDFCSQQGMEVVLVIPPYAPTVARAMADSGRYGYIPQIAPALTALCQPYGYEVFDCTYMEQTTDDQYIDGYHGGDRVYAQIAQLLGQQSRILQGQIDLDYLEAALAPGTNPLRLSA